MAAMLKWSLAVAFAAWSTAAQAQGSTSPPPADVKPGSITCEDVPVPVSGRRTCR